MIDLLRNLRKSAEEKREERLNAYLDDALSTRQRAQFEDELERDAALQADLERSRTVRDWLGQLPRQRAPRNFTLDPARYGRPQREPLVQAYPVLRVATALTAFFFIFAIALQLLTAGGTFFMEPETADVAQVEVTRVVTEVEIAGTEVPAPAMAAEEAVEGFVEMEVQEEEAAEEEVIEGEPVEELLTESEESVAADTGESDADRGATADDAADAAPEMGVAAVATASVTPSSAATPAPAATVVPSATPLPTATISEVPRPATDEAAGVDRLAETVAPSATPTPPAPQPPAPRPDLFSTTWISAGLGGLLVLLAALTLLARRRL